MINRAMLTLVHTFDYDPGRAASVGTTAVLSDHDRDDFLPYVGNFFTNTASGSAVRSLTVMGGMLKVRLKPSSDGAETISSDGGKIYLMADNVGILTLSFQFGAIEETAYAEIQRALCRLDRINTAQISQVGADSGWQDIGTYYRSLVAAVLPRVDGQRDPFNPFNRSGVVSSSILAVSSSYPDMPAFIESLLLNRKFTGGEPGTFLSDSIKRVRQSESVESFGNSTGVVYLCRDNGSEFSRSGVFGTYGKNYLLIFLITVYQQVRIHALIEKSSQIIAPSRSKAAIKELKDEIITYLARTDFTQISHNPARNLLYKFFRNNFEVRELLDEVATIVKKIDQEIEAEKAHIHAEKAHKGEIIALILEVLILPYYLHHILELVLKYCSHDEHFIHEAAFWGTIGATMAVIVGIQVLLRVFRK